MPSALVAAALLVSTSLAGDWPMWRHDAGHTAASPEELPGHLHLQWVIELPNPKACWPWTQYRLQFDVSYEPVVMGKTLFVPSMMRDTVTAYDTDTGAERWRFYADGPVRFAPAAWRGKVYFVSDDGYLYCLDAQTGRLVWKRRGGPSGRKVLGNERLISMWPARGGPVVYDDKVYFAASVWPFMGTFIHALDAETGKVVWTNSGTSATYVLQPHSSPAFAGVAPQGYLVATQDRLLVAGSRSVPAAFDRRTGKLLYYRANISKPEGGYAVAARQDWFFNANFMYHAPAGNRLVGLPAQIMTQDAVIGVDGDGAIAAHALSPPNERVVTKKDRKGREYKRRVYSSVPLWRIKTTPALLEVFINAGSRVFGAGKDGLVAAVDMPKTVQEAKSPEPKRAASETEKKGTTELIPKGAEWQYLAGSHPEGDWTSAQFDERGWKTGNAGFGYGDNDDATVLGDMKGKYKVVYIRRKFMVDKAKVSPKVGLLINYDDAFVAYLNGKEIVRAEVREGSGKNAKGIAGHEAKGYEFFEIKGLKELLRDDGNVLAIEGNNANVNSSDLSLDPYLAEPDQEKIASQPAVPVTQAPFSWKTEIDGQPWTMLAADGKLFVVTKEGRIYCFGPRRVQPRTHKLSRQARGKSRDKWSRVARTILEKTGVSEGYCVVLAMGTGRLAEELAASTKLHIVGLDPDAGKIGSLRRKFDQMGLYGERIAVIVGDVRSVQMPPYLASLVVSEDIDAADCGQADFAERVFRILRPYGGVACLPLSGEPLASLRREAQSGRLPNAQVDESSGLVLLTRAGKLPGSADWTHQYGDVANRVFSPDLTVKAPLGLLWFGGPSHIDVLPRHGHGPPQQVVGGRLFIQGIKGIAKQDTYPGIMSARDVYTGRTLWRREFPELDTSGMYYSHTYNPDPNDRTYNQTHIPGANELGTNFVATQEHVYLVHGAECLVLHASTGKTLKRIELPKLGYETRPNWGYIGVYGDLLIAGAGPLGVTKVKVEVEGKAEEVPVLRANDRFGAGSKHLVVIDRHSGEALWTRKANYNFRHNCIVAGNGKVYCVDGMSGKRLEYLKRRGHEPSEAPQITALDARTGKELWSSGENVFGTWLGYSGEFDTLLEAGSRAGDRARDEVGHGMAAYRAADGAVLWRIDATYSGPPILRHDMVITQTGGGNTSARPANVYSLRTGQVVTRVHPMTGQTVPWNWVRFKGCNTAIASEHLMTFRCASAAFVDFTTGQGTFSIGGFKSGCTSNLVVADGVLNAPDYTRTCLCAYQNQASLALVHMPEVEMWSFDYYPAPEAPTPVLRLGINLGAPGNRFAPNGTLWLEHPSVGGPSPDIPIRTEPASPEGVRRHMSAVNGQLTWVTASGLKGSSAVTIRPFLQPAAEPKDAKAKKKPFSVTAFDMHADKPLPPPATEPLGEYPQERPYTVRLYFAELEGKTPGERTFHVALQGKEVLNNFDIAQAAGGTNRSVVREFSGVGVRTDIKVELTRAAASKAEPLLCGIELLSE